MPAMIPQTRIAEGAILRIQVPIAAFDARVGDFLFINPKADGWDILRAVTPNVQALRKAVGSGAVISASLGAAGVVDALLAKPEPRNRGKYVLRLVK